MDSDDEEMLLTIVTAAIIEKYYSLYICREPCRTSILTGYGFVREVLDGNPTRCYELFRMEKYVFHQLCSTLKRKNLLKNTKRMCVEEQLAILLLTIGYNESNRNTQERFQHSGETISQHFNEVLRAMVKFGQQNDCKYYVVDAGYPNMPGFLAPYKGERYHLQDYRGGRNPRNLRNVIERCFGVLKARFPILKAMPAYPVSVQKFIVIAACVVHNFIRQEVQRDNLFTQFENEELVVDDSEHVVDDAPNLDRIIQAQSQQEMEKFRDDLANAIFNAYNRGGVQNYRQ
ncbi:hypothetical protein L1049_014272 [Liquidambar formosana]|uniref:DUF8040 domain-containing protein n=1 Tax=Liquidambar formosana TaxID=63359 RepID=A0AAP0RML1_LIQFO